MIPLDKDRILLEIFAFIFAACDDDVLSFKGDDLDFHCFVHFHFSSSLPLVSIHSSVSFQVVVISRSGSIGCCCAIRILIEELSHLIYISGRTDLQIMPPFLSFNLVSPLTMTSVIKNAFASAREEGGCFI